MIKFLMVHTVFKKRQYDFIYYDERKQGFMEFLHNLRNRNNSQIKKITKHWVKFPR